MRNGNEYRTISDIPNLGTGYMVSSSEYIVRDFEGTGCLESTAYMVSRVWGT